MIDWITLQGAGNTLWGFGLFRVKSPRSPLVRSGRLLALRSEHCTDLKPVP